MKCVLYGKAPSIKKLIHFLSFSDAIICVHDENQSSFCKLEYRDCDCFFLCTNNFADIITRINEIAKIRNGQKTTVVLDKYVCINSRVVNTLYENLPENLNLTLNINRLYDHDYVKEFYQKFKNFREECISVTVGDNLPELNWIFSTVPTIICNSEVKSIEVKYPDIIKIQTVNNSFMVKKYTGVDDELTVKVNDCTIKSPNYYQAILNCCKQQYFLDNEVKKTMLILCKIVEDFYGEKNTL